MLAEDVGLRVEDLWFMLLAVEFRHWNVEPTAPESLGQAAHSRRSMASCEI